MAERGKISARFPRGAVVPLAAALVWWLSIKTGVLSGPMAVAPLQVVTVPFLDPSGRELWPALLESLLRVLAGSLIGGLCGIVLGYLAGTYRVVVLGVAPSIHAVRQVALFAWIPLLTAWFGNGEATKIVFTALSAFFPLFLATEQGIRQTPIELVEAAHVLKLRYRTCICRLYFPAALPSIYLGLQIGILSAWIGTIGAEYAIGNGRGLGSYLASARDQFRMDIVLVCVFALAFGGVLLTHIVRLIAASLSPWTSQQR
ncbi:ABC transporter permease subunit [Rhizobium lusitanum]|uniref:ABC transporter permease subunit n=1 Tax=Rhizobium lusitanum TaxID=293958 RepID=A0A6L9UDY9_9HYPH|nr:ABC transporter permease [Rhizobium lusitanum]NEI72838.1 ABC transporter permease subunit [Rhizobium lusitanum]